MTFHENKKCRIICYLPITPARKSLLAEREQEQDLGRKMASRTAQSGWAQDPQNWICKENLTQTVKTLPRGSLMSHRVSVRGSESPLESPGFASAPDRATSGWNTNVCMFHYFWYRDLLFAQDRRTVTFNQLPSARLNKWSWLCSSKEVTDSKGGRRCKGLARQMWVFLTALPLTNEQPRASDHSFLGTDVRTFELRGYIMKIKQTFGESPLRVKHFLLFNPLKTLWSGYYCSHFTPEETRLRKVK